jgi:hypothetical protein
LDLSGSTDFARSTSASSPTGGGHSGNRKSTKVFDQSHAAIFFIYHDQT